MQFLDSHFFELFEIGFLRPDLLAPETKQLLLLSLSSEAEHPIQ